jgi:hypothetical protein
MAERPRTHVKRSGGWAAFECQRVEDNAFHRRTQRRARWTGGSASPKTMAIFAEGAVFWHDVQSESAGTTRRARR